MPAKPRWLLALPDAIQQLEALDQDLLTRRDLERLFGVSKVRATQLMTAFGAGRTGHLLTLPRAALLRQLRRPRPLAAVRGEATRRARVVTALRQARLIGIRVAVPRAAREARLAGLPDGVSVAARPDRGALPQRQGRRRAALRARPGADQRLRALRGVGRGGRPGRRRGSGAGMNDDVVRVARTDSARTARAPRAALVLPRLIVDAGPVAVEKFLEFFRRADRQPADAGGVRASRGAVPGVVRGAGPGAHGGRAAARGGLHPDPPRVGAHRQAAPGGPPHARPPARPGARLGDALQLRAG